MNIRFCIDGSVMKYSFRFVAILGFTALLVGCASRSALLVARRDSAEAPTSMTGIALVNHPKPRPEDDRLERVLIETLQREGITPKPASEAEFVMACWIDDSWDEVVPATQTSYQRSVTHVTVGNASDSSEGRLADEYARRASEQRAQPARYLSVKGIKLRVYSNRATGAARVAPVWEGYVEVGSIESSAHLAEAVRSLLAHFGQDFTGRVRFPK